MLSSPVIDLAIGLTFVFAVTAALASLVTEFIARFLGLRGAYLLSGLRELVDSGEKATVLTNVATDYKTMQTLIKGPPYANDKAPDDKAPVPARHPPPIRSHANPKPRHAVSDRCSARRPDPGQSRRRRPDLRRSLTLDKTAGQRDGSLATITSRNPGAIRSQLRSLPSYISVEVFRRRRHRPGGARCARADHHGYHPEEHRELPDDPFRTSLEALVKNANGDVSKFRTSVEQWYDDHMDRVSGWYKRRTAWITLVVGAIVVVLLNLNALTIGRTLYTENAVSAAVSSVAAKTTPCTTVSQDCLSKLDGDLSAAAASGLPVGWGTVRACKEQGVHCGWWEQRGILSPSGSAGSQAAQILLVLLGFLIMIVALLPGAQFWFGLLSKLGTLRSSGPKPAAAASTAISLTVSPPIAASVESEQPN